MKNIIMENILSFILTVFTLGFYPYVYRGTHKFMQSDHNPISISYREFKKLFETIDWRFESEWPRSLFNRDGSMNHNCCHANVLRVNDKYYLLSSGGLFMANQLIKRKIKELS